MTESKKPLEFENFDGGVREILPVSHEELQRREEQWKRERKQARKKAEVYDLRFGPRFPCKGLECASFAQLASERSKGKALSDDLGDCEIKSLSVANRAVLVGATEK